MTRTDANITRYSDGEFLVDIVDTATMYEAWLSHKSYGISDYMFGVPKKSDNCPDMTMAFFLEIVQGNLPEHEQSYAERYFD